MTVPTVVAATGALPASNAASWNLALGNAAGAYVVIILSTRNNSVPGDQVVADPGAPWSIKGVQAAGSNTRSLTVIAGFPATANATIALAANDAFWTANIYRFTGADSCEVAFAVNDAVASNSNPPSLTVASGAVDAMWLAAQLKVGTIVATAAPANYTNLLTQVTNSTSGASTSSARRSLTATATEDPGTFTASANAWIAATIAVFAGATGNGSGILSTVTLTTPAGTATGTAVGVGAIPAIAAAAPSGAASGAGHGSGPIGTVTLAAPAGTASFGADGAGSGSIPAAQVSAPEGSASGDGAAAADLAMVSASAPEGIGSGSATASGAGKVVALFAPQGTASTADPTETPPARITHPKPEGRGAAAASAGNRTTRPRRAA